MDGYLPGAPSDGCNVIGRRWSSFFPIIGSTIHNQIIPSYIFCNSNLIIHVY